ncbi:serine/threonine protein kinase [Serratia marcescens]|nr:serine/threonine protein kinase [Serratia marcescens]
MTNKTLPERYKCTKDRESGGFGSVVKCLDVHLDRFVAIKSINDPEDSGRMRDEFSALMKMRSKHVVELFDVIEFEGGDISIVEEYIDGPSLHDVSDDIRDANHLVKILWQIASGISEIHAHDIIHRDIKPGNMKIDQEGLVKIFDFGLSRNIDNAKTVGFKGTPIFAAPELYMQNVNFTKAIDTYAFSVTAMCLAKTPIPDEMTRYPKILTSNPFDNSEIQLPNFLKNLLYRCLDSSPQNRPSMWEVCNGLKKFLLYNSHRALLISISENKPARVISATNKTEFYDNPGVGSIEITYSGSEFYISNISGEVHINNIKARQHNILPNSCVIILGPSGKSSVKRIFITFDLSHPEVVL